MRSHEDWFIGRWVLAGSLAGLLAVVCGVGCGEVAEFPDANLGTVQEAVRPGLQQCTSSYTCGAGLVCCAGFCATPESGSGKIASLNTQGRLSYKCYASS